MFIPDRLKILFTRKKTPEELDEHYRSIKLEKGDLSAMIIAALITFLPVLLVAMLVFYGLLWILFIR